MTVIWFEGFDSLVPGWRTQPQSAANNARAGFRAAQARRLAQPLALRLAWYKHNKRELDALIGRKGQQ